MKLLSNTYGKHIKKNVSTLLPFLAYTMIFFFIAHISLNNYISLVSLDNNTETENKIPLQEGLEDLEIEESIDSDFFITGHSSPDIKLRSIWINFLFHASKAMVVPLTMDSPPPKHILQ